VGSAEVFVAAMRKQKGSCARLGPGAAGGGVEDRLVSAASPSNGLRLRVARCGGVGERGVGVCGGGVAWEGGLGSQECNQKLAQKHENEGETRWPKGENQFLPWKKGPKLFRKEGDDSNFFCKCRNGFWKLVLTQWPTRADTFVLLGTKVGSSKKNLECKRSYSYGKTTGLSRRVGQLGATDVSK